MSTLYKNSLNQVSICSCYQLSTLAYLYKDDEMDHLNRVNFNYSTKNIPIPSRNSFKKRLIEKVESVIKRMRWKALFFMKDNDDSRRENTETTQDVAEDDNCNFGFKSRKCPPQIKELIPFEDDMLQMIENLRFRNTSNQFQDKLREDIKNIKRSGKLLIPADKTRNLYEMDNPLCEKLLRENITKSYQTTSLKTVDRINSEARAIAADLEIDERMESIAKKQAFITLKDHKDNFENTLPCRLINPAKSETGIISKVILDKINNAVRRAIGVNQWRSTNTVIEWFKSITEKEKHTFISFDVVNFYPSITEKLLKRAIDFAKEHANITTKDIQIIMHARKSVLFDKDTPWKKKNNDSLFDVTMGSFDGAEVCELVGLYILNILSNEYGKEHIGLYRDDGLAVFKNISGSEAERIRKNIIKTFKKLDLQITISCNLKITNFLDVTLNLSNGKYYPYRKPNDQPMYIHTQSNHPPSVINALPASISRRVSDISCDKETFKKATPIYNDALKSSGYTDSLCYKDNQPKRRGRNRQRNITWFNPPFSKNVSTNIGCTFLKLIDKHFPKKSKLNRIFNRNTLKVSYSCMPNIDRIIKAHNKQTLEKDKKPADKSCNCRNKNLCPLQGKCLTPNVIYNAEVKSQDKSKTYIGLTEPPFKLRYNNHLQSFRHERYQNSTELSKYIWHLNRHNTPYTIKWSIASHAQPYTNESKRCDLCLTEKLLIMSADKQSLLNKRPELISKCRHQNKFYLCNFKNEFT